jgi:galactoside O-acetyltransferase
MAMLSPAAIERIGFASVGRGAQISELASIHGAARIHIGDHSRIDDFCLVSAGPGGIFIGRRVHIGAYASLLGAAAITLEDFAGLSSRVSIYSSSDDYSGAAMTNPTVPARYTNVTAAEVRLGRHVIVGAGSVILPGATLEEGVAVGALSLVKGVCAAFGIYSGAPARRIKERRRDLLEAEARLRAEEAEARLRAGEAEAQ